MALNAKQRIFVKEYLKSRNATRAARAAGYSAKSAPTNGPRLLENAGVRAAIDASLNRITEKAELKAADVLAEIRKLAFVKLRDAYDEDGKLLDLHQMPEDVASALNTLESEEIFVGRGSQRLKVGVARKVKLADKIRALEMLAKHFKLLTDVTENTNVNSGDPQVVFHFIENGSEAKKP